MLTEPTKDKYNWKVWENIGLDEYGENNNRSVAFEFQMPDKVNQSYTGKYSEYFCGLEAKLNIAWSSDINARTIIEVVWLISAILEIVMIYDLSHDLANYILLRFILSKWVEGRKR